MTTASRRCASWLGSQGWARVIRNNFPHHHGERYYSSSIGAAARPRLCATSSQRCFSWRNIKMSSRSPSRVQWQLWHPSQGIHFATAEIQQQQKHSESLYPDLGEFSLDSNSSGAGPSSSIAPGRDPGLAAGRKFAPPVLQPTSSAGSKEDDGHHHRPPAEASAPLKEEDKPKNGQESSRPLPPNALIEEPPFTPLDYTIPLKAFRAAKLAKPDTAESFWAYSLYRGPNDDKVKVHYCTNKHTTERVCQQYFMNEKVIGFDLEWMASAARWSGARRNVCLVQLASQSRVALFHLAVFPYSETLVAPSLKKIMEDPAITKAGVNIKGDCTRLRTYLGIDPRGIFELSHLFKLIKYTVSGESHLINKRPVALAEQVQHWLRLPLFKGADVRNSDWMKRLDLDQIIYSSSDAYAAVQLYAVMDHNRQNLQPTPPLPYHAELDKPIRRADAVAPAVDEEPEDAEEYDEGEDDQGNETGAPPTVLSREFISSVTDTIQVEAGADEADHPSPLPAPTPAAATTPARGRKSAAAAAEKKQQPPKDERILAAEAWAAAYRASRAKPPRATAAALRTYHIWSSNSDLDPPAVASVLRDPPLQTSTVRNYILEAIRWEKLPYEHSRLRVEVWEPLEAASASRYSSVGADMERAAARSAAGQQ